MRSHQTWVNTNRPHSTTIVATQSFELIKRSGHGEDKCIETGHIRRRDTGVDMRMSIKRQQVRAHRGSPRSSSIARLQSAAASASRKVFSQHKRVVVGEITFEQATGINDVLHQLMRGLQWHWPGDLRSRSFLANGIRSRQWSRNPYPVQPVAGWVVASRQILGTGRQD